MISLDRNESYWLLDAELKHILHLLSPRSFSTYPSYEVLKDRIAKYVGVSPQRILITPGSDAAIEHIAQVYVRDAKALLPAPTFYGYESILDRSGATLIPCMYREYTGGFAFPLQEVEETLVRESPAAVFLCHPNNPLGVSLREDEIQRLVNLANTSETLFVVDEAYFEFSEMKSFSAFLGAMPNLIVLRTFSKSFALAGARVGFALTTPERVHELEQQLLPWPIAHTSVSVACMLLDQVQYVQERLEVYKRVRTQFQKAVEQIRGVSVYPSETNFLLIRVPNAVALSQWCLAHGIRVALGSSLTRFTEAKKLLQNTIRIAIPAPYDLAYVLTVLTEGCKVSV
jgi:histidinol-phosphate aminotransferase